MTTRLLPLLAVAAAAALALTSCAAGDGPTAQTATTTPVPTGAAVLTPVIGSVLAEPVPVPTSDGKVHLAYELILTNTLSQPVRVTSLAARSGDKTLLELGGSDLASWMRLQGGQAPTTEIGPAQLAKVWLDVVVEKDSVPTDLTHSLALTFAQPQPPVLTSPTTETIAPTPVSTRKPIAIDPPLKGPNWLDGNGCCGMTPHRMAITPLNGALWAPERFAIDYVQLAGDGTLFTGDRAKVESYPYFGADVRAVADGPVVAVVDSLPEQVAGVSPSNLPLDQYAGNHIVQDLGDGHYALYAHLKTGSVKVKVGDKLSTGQVFAALGNTGNTDAPHLHFHLMSGPDPLHSNGLPFVFRSYTLDGRLADDAALDQVIVGGPGQRQPGLTTRDETDTMPLYLDLTTYSGG